MKQYYIFLKTICLLLFALFVSTKITTAQTITNGGFDGFVPNQICYTCVPPGWTAYGGSPITSPDWFEASSNEFDHFLGLSHTNVGDNYMSLDAGPGYEAGLIQTITGLIPGTVYGITIDQVWSIWGTGDSGFPGGLKLLVDGVETDRTDDRLVPAFAKWGTVPGPNWERLLESHPINYTYKFTATATSHTINLVAFVFSGPRTQISLDNVKLITLVPPCNAGVAQVTLINTALSNVCPSITVNLNSTVNSSSIPANTNLVWFTNANHTGTAYATPAAAGAGTYFAFFYDAVNDCYNTNASTANVVVSINTALAQPVLSAVTQPTCTVSTGSFSITNFDASFTYTVNPSAGVIITGNTITAPAGNSYTVTATQGSCSSPASASVTVNAAVGAPVAPVIGAITQPLCPATTGSVALSGLPSSGSWTINITPSVAGATGVSGSGATTTVANLPGGNYAFTVTSAGCTSPASSSAVINNSSCPVGTIDCNKTMLTPAPTSGIASQLDLVITVNVTSAGCFTPITVSGSGFTLATGVTQICAVNTGIQQLHVPVNYDGSTLGTLSFTIGQAGACNADLTKPPKVKELCVWTLDNCTLKNVAPGLK